MDSRRWVRGVFFRVFFVVLLLTCSPVWGDSQVGIGLPGAGGGGGYPLVLNFAAFNPADATTYYFGSLYTLAPSSATDRRLYIPKAGAIKKVFIYLRSGGVGTAESSSFHLRVNNTTDYEITSGHDMSNSPAMVSVTSLNVAVGDDFADYVEIKWTTPTWATNPTTVSGYAIIWIE